MKLTVSFVLFFLECYFAPINAAETKAFRFKANTTITSGASTTDQLNGEYIAVVSNGKCEGMTSDRQYLIGGGAALELCRMVGIDPDNRMYLNHPHSIKKEWSQASAYSIPALRNLRRTIHYKVTGEETITTSGGKFPVFKIEGDARINNIDQKWVYYYNEDTGAIVKFFYDGAVGQAGAKVEIELIGDSTSKP